MTYKELLNLCIEKPGCIQTKEQKQADSNMIYRLWVEKMDEDYYRKKRKKNSGR